MKEWIEPFLNQKSLSANSYTAYRYDLLQFLDAIDGEINLNQLKRYQTFLKTLKPTAQKRKSSIVNQFLYFLYQEKQVHDYLKLTLPKMISSSKSVVKKDLTHLRKTSSDSLGALIALLILELGLLPSEILALKVDQISLEFKIVTVVKAGQRRILEIPPLLLQKLEGHLSGTYLFEHGGTPYSRQWLFIQLDNFLKEEGEEELTAQALREQYILQALEDGKDLHQLAKDLGLKSILTLEKYK